MKILIIRFSALGDLVTLEPTFRAFRFFFKSSHITFLTSYVGKSLYKDTKYFDNFVVFEDFLNTVKSLRGEKYDLVVNLQCNKPSHYINFFIKKDRTVNKSYNFWQKIFHIKVVSKSPEELLIKCGVEKDKVESFFKKNSIIELPLKIDKDIEKEIKERVADKKIVVLAMGASKRWVSKKWGIDNYEKLIDKLKEDFGIILIGTKLEESDAKILSKKYSEVINFVNRTDLKGLKSVLKIADLVVGSDSGPMHLAASVGSDTYIIFTSTDKKHSPRFGSYKGKHYFATPSKKITCYPCYKSRCPKDMECAKDISVDKVYEDIKEILNG